MRIAPGFSSDDQELNSGLSAQSIQAIRRAHLADANIPRFYAQYLAALMRGDLGTSRSLNQPVKELLRERLPTTLMNLAFALAVGWLLGLALAIAAQFMGHPGAELSCQWTEWNFYFHSRGCAGAGLLMLRWPPAFAAALLVSPKFIATRKTCCSRAARCRTCLRRAQKARGHGGSWHGTLRRLHFLRSLRWWAFPSALELAFCCRLKL